MEKSKRKEKDFLCNWFNVPLLVGMVLVGMSCGQDTSGEITSDDIYFDDGYNQRVDNNLPKLTFENTDFNFGIIIEGEVVRHTYKFKNTGKSDLIISDVHPSCGCTTSKEFTKEPIKPDGEGEITVEFDSQNRAGDVKKSISVTTNAKPNRSVLYILGEVISAEKIEKLEKN